MSDVQISVRVPRSLFEALKERAEQEDRSLSAEVRRALRIACENANLGNSGVEKP